MCKNMVFRNCHSTKRKNKKKQKLKKCKRNYYASKKHSIEHVIGFLGNPNVGKSSLFNELTGSHQHIGNWPGKTVEKKEGHFILADEYFSVVDLPGTYSLSGRSDEEIITEEFIVQERPDLVCVIADAMRLERTLYLALQAFELTDKVAIIVNMIDVAEKHNLEINRKKLENSLGVPVILVSALRDSSLIELKKFIYDALHTDKYHFHPAKIFYSDKIEGLIRKISEQIEDRKVLKEYPTRWIAIKLLEEDNWIKSELAKEFDLDILLKTLEEIKEKEKINPKVEIAKTKYSGLHTIVTQSVKGDIEFKETLSDKIDKIVLHPIFGYPILVLIYALFFFISFSISSPIIDGMSYLLNLFAEYIRSVMIQSSSPEIITSFVVDGVISGISAFLLFLPLIIVFYTLVAIMEDSGYLARSAYLMDRFMSKFGLQGTAFLSIVMGFGCNAAGILATRIIKNPKDRIRMIVSLSFIPCAATLGVIAFITGIFFAPWKASLIMLGLYAFSIFLTLISSSILRLFMEKEDPLPLILEMPEYRKPILKNIYYLTWSRAGVFVKKAGTFIFSASIFIWILSNLPYNVSPEFTILGYLGKVFSFVTYPLMGLSWEMIAPLVFGVAAKETIIVALGVIYASGDLKSVLLNLWTFPQVISFLLFQLTYAPCFPTIAAVKSETNSNKWALFSILWPLFLTTLITTIVYQILNLII